MPASASSYRLLLATYVAAIFVSAALLFAVQPLFAKMVLPRLGGNVAVKSVRVGCDLVKVNHSRFPSRL